LLLANNILYHGNDRIEGKGEGNPAEPFLMRQLWGYWEWSERQRRAAS